MSFESFRSQVQRFTLYWEQVLRHREIKNSEPGTAQRIAGSVPISIRLLRLRECSRVVPLRAVRIRDTGITHSMMRWIQPTDCGSWRANHFGTVAAYPASRSRRENATIATRNQRDRE
jgi:hypothetical protein